MEKVAYKLELPRKLKKFYIVFYVSLLKAYKEDVDDPDRSMSKRAPCELKYRMIEWLNLSWPIESYEGSIRNQGINILSSGNDYTIARLVANHAKDFGNSKISLLYFTKEMRMSLAQVSEYVMGCDKRHHKKVSLVLEATRT